MSIDPHACAFPTGHEGDPGLTIRAYIATQLMAAHVVRYGSNMENSRDAVSNADALIAALNSPVEQDQTT